MNERQRDLFLWLWRRRRARGQMGAAIAGGLIGFAGGLLFTVLFFALPEMAGQTAGALNTSGMAPFEAALANRLGARGFVLLLAGGLFALMGFALAWRVFGMQEAQYQRLLAQGAVVPAEKPALALRDRGPMIAVIVAFAVIAIFILAVAFGVGGL
jgi:hypothetical protein